MKTLSTRLVLVCCCATSLVGLSQTSAVTIYRIGGDSFPEPDADALGAPADSMKFVQLSWDEVDEPPFGSSHLVEIRPDSIRPDFITSRNVTPEVEDRGGFIRGRETGTGFFSFKTDMALMYDGKPETYYLGQPPMAYFSRRDDFISVGAPYCVGDGNENACKFVWVALNGAYPLQRIRIYPSPQNEERRFVPIYTIGISDGDPLKSGTRERSIAAEWLRDPPIFLADFDLIAEVFENRSALLEFEFTGEPMQEILFIAPVGNWEIAEFEIYVHGFAVSSNYTSEAIDLTEFGTLGPLTWSGELHPGARVDLRVRSGDTADPQIYFRNTFRGAERTRYDAEGDPLDRATYLGLEEGERGGVAPDLENWSTLSSPLEFGDHAAEFGAARPRRYVQFRADFHSGGRLDYLQFPVTQPPLATRAVAEIEPERVAAREVTRFTYFLRPEIRADDLGFDRIRIATPTRIDSVESVSINGVPLEPSQWQAAVDSTSFEVSLPRMDGRRTRELVAVVFHARIFDYGTVFEGRVSDSTRPWEVPQILEPGDAAFLAESNSLTVELIDVGREVVDEIELSTAVFTPNGDGVNDRLDIGFDLVNLSEAVPVKLEVFDLTGTRRAELPLARLGSGPHSVSWDGTDDRRKLLAPGLYVLRLDVATDDATFTASRVVSIAY